MQNSEQFYVIWVNNYRLDLYRYIHYFKTESSCFNFFSISEKKCKFLCCYMWFRNLHIYSLFHLRARVQLFSSCLFIFWNSEKICKILNYYIRFRILLVFSLFQEKIFKDSKYQWYQMVFYTIMNKLLPENSDKMCKVLYNCMHLRILHLFSLF